MSEFLTTKEVAALLRIKERKVYELVSRDAIPVSRATGKLLFPRAMIESWVLRQTDYGEGLEGLSGRPPVMAGSHDPLLDWALRESGCGLANLFDGSLDGLTRLAQGQALAAGLHIYEPELDDWNREHVARTLAGLPVVLVEWAWRRQGLVVAPGNPKGIGGLSDLTGLNLIPRQEKAGSQVLLHHLMAREGLEPEALKWVSPPARSEADVALAVAEGKADAGLGVQTVAQQYRLDFVPLFRERYDLVVWRRDYFEAPIQTLLAFAHGSAFAKRAEELGGYDVTDTGRIHYNGP